jgi:hypothetical protein
MFRPRSPCLGVLVPSAKRPQIIHHFTTDRALRVSNAITELSAVLLQGIAAKWNRETYGASIQAVDRVVHQGAERVAPSEKARFGGPFC